MSNVVRNRGHTVKTLKGTQSLHAVRCVEANVLRRRTLSCTCDPCCSGLGECVNREKVGPLERKALKPETAWGETDKVALHGKVAVRLDPPALGDEVVTSVGPPAQEEELANSADSVPTQEAVPADQSHLEICEGDFVKVQFSC